PDGTLIDLFALYHFINSGGGGQFQEKIFATRSTDKGISWSAPIVAVNMLPILVADYILTTDPDTGHLVQDGGTPPLPSTPATARSTPHGKTPGSAIFNTTASPSRCPPTAASTGPRPFK